MKTSPKIDQLSPPTPPGRAPLREYQDVTISNTQNSMQTIFADKSRHKTPIKERWRQCEAARLEFVPASIFHCGFYCKDSVRQREPANPRCWISASARSQSSSADPPWQPLASQLE